MSVSSISGSQVYQPVSQLNTAKPRDPDHDGDVDPKGKADADQGAAKLLNIKA